MSSQRLASQRSAAVPRPVGSCLRTWLAAAALGLIVACGALPPGAHFPKTESVALQAHAETALGIRFLGPAAEHPGKSAFRILSVGVDGFVTRVRMAEAAEKTLDLQYYIFRGDETGRLLMSALISAANRGVRVRVLVDDGDKIPGDEQLLLLDRYRAIEVRVYNPFRYRGAGNLPRALEFAFNAPRLDYRMHNKLMVADNSVALVGGRNVGDQYFQVNPDTQFADDDVFVAGPAVRELSSIFDEFWNSELSIPAAAIARGRVAPAQSPVPATPRVSRWRSRKAVASGIDYGPRLSAGEPYTGILSGELPLVWAAAQVFGDVPDKRVRSGTSASDRGVTATVAEATRAVRSELVIVTPYFVPAESERRDLGLLRQNGVRIRILTNSLASTRDVLAFSAYTRYRMGLLREGVELYETRAQLGSSRGSGQTARMSAFGNYGLHAKLWVFDKQRVFAGSMNFDQRSKRINTEVGVIIDSAELSAQVLGRFQNMVQTGNAYALATGTAADPSAPGLRWVTEQQGQPREFLRDPDVGACRRWLVGFLATLPVAGEL